MARKDVCCDCGCKDGECGCNDGCECEVCHSEIESCLCESGYEEYTCEFCSAPDEEYLRDLDDDEVGEVIEVESGRFVERGAELLEAAEAGGEVERERMNAWVKTAEAALLEQDGRERLYEWEDNTFVMRKEDLSLDECQRLVNKACMRRTDEVPLVGPTQRTHRACLDLDPRPGTTLSRIWLPKRARNKVTVLHETAHAIAPQDGHGPLFARVHIELLAGEGFGEIDDLVASAGAAGVKIARRED